MQIWADTVVDPNVHGEARGFTRDFQTSDGPAEAHLDTDGTCLYIDADPGDAAQIACVFRDHVPGSIEVIFCARATTSTW
ncbi:hypothetical protein [Streptomyces vinaceus]|uniref:hypothetical protein n=1 Tax=Streptomyces vinaceus TaxID=1960 RepID=UPI0038297F47